MAQFTWSVKTWITAALVSLFLNNAYNTLKASLC
jgi:hypothetical protein